MKTCQNPSNYTPFRCSTGRGIARDMMKRVKQCQWHRVGGCKGPLDVAHLDGDERHNERSNLRKLCRSHHRLLDLRAINPRRRVMPAFRVRLSGKRAGERRYVEARRREREQAKLRRAAMFNPAQQFNATAVTVS